MAAGSGDPGQNVVHGGHEITEALLGDEASRGADEGRGLIHAQGPTSGTGHLRRAAGVSRSVSTPLATSTTRRLAAAIRGQQVLERSRDDDEPIHAPATELIEHSIERAPKRAHVEAIHRHLDGADEPRPSSPSNASRIKKSARAP